MLSPLTMLDHFAVSLIPSLRFAVIILWFIPILWAMPSYRKVIMEGELTFNEWARVAFATVGLAMVGIQTRAFFSGALYNDYWSAVMLLLACLAAIITMAVVYWVAQPINCRRAMFRTHLGIFVLCMIGGFL